MAKRRHTKDTREARPPRWAPVTFLMTVFIVKLVVMLQLKDHPLLQPEGGLDSLTYLHLAERVLGGDVTLGPGLYYVSPLYIYFLAATLGIGGSFTFVRIVQIALGTCAVWFVFLTARAWFGARAAWIAAVLASLTGVFTFYEILVLQSALDTFLTAAALCALAYGFPPEGGSYEGILKGRGLTDRGRGDETDRGRRDETDRGKAETDPVASGFSRKILLAGVIFGLQVLNRPNVAIAVAGIVVALFMIRRARVALALAAGVVLALTPVIARNAVVSRQFALVSSQGGLNFYIGNNASATGQYTAVPGVRANIEGQSEDTRRVAEQAVGHPLTDAEVSSYFTNQATSWMRNQPGAAAKLFARKLALVFNHQHQWLDFSYPYYAHETGSILAFLIVGPWLLVPLGFFGAALLTGSSGSGGSSGSTGSGFWVWWSFVPLYAISVALFFVAERYRLPLFVPLCVTAGAALERLLSALRVLRPRSPIPDLRSLAALCIAGAVLTAWPFRLNDGRYDERLRLAKELMNERDFARAATELEEAHRIDPSNSVAEFNLGIALMNEGRGSEAVAHIRHAVDAGVPVEGARYALAGALMTIDHDEGVRLLRTFSPAPGDSADSCYQVAMMALNAGVPDVAERYLTRALALRPGWQDARQMLQRIGR